MKIIGLTGGIASGKTTVTETLQGLGAHVINMDQVSHECMEPGKTGWNEIVKCFGEEILNGNGEIDRKYLGSVVFSCQGKLEKLNVLMHPLILEETQRQVFEFGKMHPDGILVEEIPLLYEIHLDEKNLFDEIWVVWVNKSCQIERLMKRDGCSETEALQRLQSQMELDEKAKKSDFVIDNMGSRENTVRQVEKYFSVFITK